MRKGHIRHILSLIHALTAGWRFVRQVDGASLEEVVTEERFHKKFLYIVVSIVGILCIAFGFRYTWKRWATKLKGQSP